MIFDDFEGQKSLDKRNISEAEFRMDQKPMIVIKGVKEKKEYGDRPDSRKVKFDKGLNITSIQD